jgi:hypothetical protein
MKNIGFEIVPTFLSSSIGDVVERFFPVQLAEPETVE